MQRRMEVARQVRQMRWAHELFSSMLHFLLFGGLTVISIDIVPISSNFPILAQICSEAEQFEAILGVNQEVNQGCRKRLLFCFDHM